MEDMIIKGTGNSRWLKSVANIMTLYPTYESFAEALAVGTFPIDLNGINPAGVETLGTRLNKASLLTDALCTALGLSTTATPTQAMDKLKLLIDNGTKIQETYYIGNGKYGNSNISGITFNFPFKVVFMIGYYSNYNSVLREWVPFNIVDEYGCVAQVATGMIQSSYYKGFGFGTNRSTSYGMYSPDGRSIHWYNDTSAYAQFNAQNCRYHYVGFG